MAFMYYMRYDGVEIANPARTESYAESMRLSFLKCQQVCPTLSKALEAFGWKKPAEYTTPKLDNAPWVDPAEPYGDGFAGMYMLDGVYPMNSSTWMAQVNESLGDGGFVSTGRHGTREMTFRALLVGLDLHALQHGLNWLSTVLHRGNPCEGGPEDAPHSMYRDAIRYWMRYKDEASIPADDDMYQGPLVTNSEHSYRGLRETISARNPVAQAQIDSFNECEGNRLEFFVRCPPDVDTRYYRYFLDVHCTAGPTVLSSHEMSGECETGGAWAEVEFTLVAANPHAYRTAIDLARDASMLTYQDYIPREGKAWWVMYRNELPLTDDNVYEAPLLYTDVPHTYDGVTETIWRKNATLAPVVPATAALPVQRSHDVWVDPDCPPVPAFPGVPVTPLLCHVPYEGTWNRFTFRVGTTALPMFSELATLMEFSAVNGDVGDVRVRLVPFGDDLATDYDLQMYLHHIPAGATLRVDGRRRSIVMYSGFIGRPDVGSTFKYGPASHLVTMDATSASFRYPTLLCGGKYWLLVDVPTTLVAPAELAVSVLAIGRE